MHKPIVNIMSPEYWGGDTDASRALKHAINAASSHGAIVYIPSGVYDMRETVTIDRPVRFIGGPRTILRREEPGSFVEARTSHVSFDDITFRTDATDHRGVLAETIAAAECQHHHSWSWTNCVFEGVHLRCTASDATSSDPNADPILYGSDIVSRIQIASCVFTGCRSSHTLLLRGVTDAVISSCTFRDHGETVERGDCIKATGASTDVNILNNTITDVARDAIDVFDSHRGVISGNTIDRCGALGVDAKWQGASKQTPTGYYRVHSNHVRRCGGTGLSVSIPDSVVCGNIVEECQTGIRVNNGTGALGDDAADSESRNVVIQGNHVSQCEYGLCLYGPHATVSGNIVTACSVGGVLLHGRHCRMTGNNVYENSRYNYYVAEDAIASVDLI